MIVEKLYRVCDRGVSGVFSSGDGFGDQLFLDNTTTIQLYMEEFKITKRTPCGAWINVYDDKKFVNLKAHKKYASETKEEAITAFVRRKERQISILSSRLSQAKAALSHGLAVVNKEAEIPNNRNYQFLY